MNNISNDNQKTENEIKSANESSENLIEINILRNNIKSAEDFLNNLKQEKIVNINNDENSENISKIYSIKEFSVIKNFLNSPELSKILSFDFFNFEKTTYLNLTANDLTFIPKEFRSLVNLETLILNNNKIIKIENLEGLSNLRRIELRSNKIKEFEGLENKEKLEILSLSCNLLEKIEEKNFCEFPSLKEIGLFGNFLGNEQNMEENLKQLGIVLDLLSRKAGNVSSIYLGGNHFLHLDQAEIHRKIKEFHFKNLSKLDGQNLN